MKEERYTFIVAYTIHDDEKRGNFLELLNKKFNANNSKDEYIDQSTYGFVLASVSEGRENIKKICTDLNITDDDYVAIIYTTHIVDRKPTPGNKNIHDYMIREIIKGKTA